MRFRLRAFDVFGAERGIVPEFVSLSYSDKLNDLPTLSIKVQAGTLAAERLALPVEVALEVQQDAGSEWTEPVNCRFIATGEDRNDANPGETITVPCLGVGVVLRWASVWDATPGNEDGKRVFAASSPGLILHTLFETAAKRRDETGLAWGKGAVAWSFTPEYDSAHQAWGKNAAPVFSPADNLAKPVDWLTSKGAIDWRWQARTMHAYRTNGAMARNLTDSVVLRKEFATALPVKADHQGIVTVGRFRGENGFTKTQTARDAYREYGRIEAWSEQGQVTLDATAQLYLDELLARGKRPMLEWRREWNLAQGVSVPRLWRDYLVGDWVTAAGQELRVVEAGLTVAASGEVKGWETLGTRIDSYLERLARKTTDLEGIVGTDSGKPLPDGVDTRTPAKPTGLVADGVAVILAGRYQGVITASWHPVTTATNGTEMQIARYRFYAREDSYRGTEQTGATNGSTPSVAFYTEPARAYIVQVSAVGENGRESELSDPVRVDVPDDAIAPPTPSIPLLTEELQVITIIWDGMDLEGQPMPSDFKELQYHVTGNPSEKPRVTTAVRGASRQVALYSVDTPGDYWVRLRAVDEAGNTSAWSEPAKIEVKQLVDSKLAEQLAADAASQVESAKKDLEAGFTKHINDLGGTISYFTALSADTKPAGPGKKAGDIARGRTLLSGKILSEWTWNGSAWQRSLFAGNIVDGVTLNQIRNEGRLSDRIVDTLWADQLRARVKITSDMIEANAITASKLSVGAINGQLIDGVVIRAGQADTFGEVTYAEDQGPAGTPPPFSIGGSPVNPVKVKLGEKAPDGLIPVNGIVISGARIRSYDEAGQYWLNIDGKDNLMIGTFRTGPFDGAGVIICNEKNKESFLDLFGPDNPAIYLSRSGKAEPDQPRIKQINSNLLLLPGEHANELTGKPIFNGDKPGRVYLGGKGALVRSEIVVLTPDKYKELWEFNGNTHLKDTAKEKPSGRYSDPAYTTIGGDYIHSGGNITCMGGVTATTGITSKAGINATGNVETQGWLISRGVPSTSAASNAFVDKWGVLYKTKSARKYKWCIRSAKKDGVNPANILKLEPRTWIDATYATAHARWAEDQAEGGLHTGKWDYAAEKPQRIPGLVAEEVIEAGLGLYASYGEKGEVEGLQYDRLWTLLIPVVREQEERIKNLEAEINELKEKHQ